MLKIGITGGIGSGKTTICQVFETLGVPVFYADTVAKQVMVKDQVLIGGIINTFGAESYDAEGQLNNKHIADIVFNNVEELAKLNALVHPATFRAFDAWLSEISDAVPYVLKEAALLFESGSYKMCDKSIVVTAPSAMRIARVTERSGLSIEEVQARMDKQMSEELKTSMADFLIKNDETESVILQVLKLHDRFLK